jgi:hypothetical protein
MNKINVEDAFLDKTILSKYLFQFYLEIVDKIGLSNEAYLPKAAIPISSIIFSYGIRDGSSTNIIGLNSSKEKNIKHQIYYKNKLPITIRPEGFGKIIKKRIMNILFP